GTRTPGGHHCSDFLPGHRASAQVRIHGETDATHPLLQVPALKPPVRQAQHTRQRLIQTRDNRTKATQLPTPTTRFITGRIAPLKHPSTKQSHPPLHLLHRPLNVRQTTTAELEKPSRSPRHLRYPRRARPN